MMVTESSAKYNGSDSLKHCVDMSVRDVQADQVGKVFKNGPLKTDKRTN